MRSISLSISVLLCTIYAACSLKIYSNTKNFNFNQWMIKSTKMISILATSTAFTLTGPIEFSVAKESEPPIPLSRYFAAVRKELDPKEGVSLIRIKNDIDTSNWDDLKLFTREYDAGFRGGILKSTWKQLGDSKKRGIEISNSFTFDLIGLNQAARKGDSAEALKHYEDVKQDIKDFLTLEQQADASDSK